MIIIVASNPLQEVNELLLKQIMKVDNSAQIYIRKERYISTMAKHFRSICMETRSITVESYYLVVWTGGVMAARIPHNTSSWMQMCIKIVTLTGQDQPLW